MAVVTETTLAAWSLDGLRAYRFELYEALADTYNDANLMQWLATMLSVLEREMHLRGF